MPPQRVRVPAEELRTLATQILVSAGSERRTRRDRCGRVHLGEPAGCRLARRFTAAAVPRVVRKGRSQRASGDRRLTRPRSAVISVEADRAPGPLALTYAMREAISVARETGVAWASVRGTVHTGAIGYYTSMAAAEGLAGIGIVAGVPNMGYEGARGAAVATSARWRSRYRPSKHPDFVLDMATATIALGKIAQYKARGELLPEGVAVTADRPTDGRPGRGQDSAAGRWCQGLGDVAGLRAAGQRTRREPDRLGVPRGQEGPSPERDADRRGCLPRSCRSMSSRRSSMRRSTL